MEPRSSLTTHNRRGERDVMDLVVGRTVVIDPKVAFGRPLLARGGARVEDLVHRFQADDSVSDIATDFSVSACQAENVIRLAVGRR
jgi:uncharacterized protein (DUF433 family)